MHSALPTFRPDIDGLRAVAVLLVLVFHFDLVPGAEAGFIGVDIFFVISGFLITSVLLRQLENGSFSLRTFYVARVRRLAPALLVTLLLVMAAGTWLLFPHDLEDLALQVLVSQFYVANIYYWRSVNYFGLGTDNVFLLHMWSLGMEEQFYLLYPLALLAVHRYVPRHLRTALVLAFALSFVLNLAFVSRKPEATFYLLPTRAWELLAGALLPFVSSRWRRSVTTDGLLGMLGAALIVVAMFRHEPRTPFPGTFALLPVAGAFLLLLSGEGRTALTARCLRAAPLTYIGRISYPLYLVHWPINVFAARELGDAYQLPQRLAFFLGTVALAALIYHGVEKPVRGQRLLAANRRLVSGYAASLSGTVAIFVVIAATRGLPGRYPAEVSRIAAYVNDRTPPLRECEYADQPLTSVGHFCRLGVPGQAPRWIVYGDSHAWASHGAFDLWLRQQGAAGLFAYRHACPPLQGIHVAGDRGGCHRFNDAIFDFLRQHPAIDGVVWVSAWYEAPEGILAARPDGPFTKQGSLDVFATAFGDSLRQLRLMGKTVYVWEPVPGAGYNVPVTLARARLDGKAAARGTPRDEYLRSAAFFFDAAENNRHLIAARVSPSAVLCASGICETTLGGNPAYFDASHLAASHRATWAEVIKKAETPVAHPTAVGHLRR